MKLGFRLIEILISVKLGWYSLIQNRTYSLDKFISPVENSDNSDFFE